MKKLFRANLKSPYSAASAAFAPDTSRSSAYRPTGLLACARCVSEAKSPLSLRKRDFRLALIALFLALPAAPASSADPFDGFAAKVTADNLKPFMRDLGFLLAADINHTGRSLGFSGFDLGMRDGVIPGPRSGDTVLSNTSVALPIVQAEIGMPFRLDGFIRGFDYQGFTMSGGGLKWGFTQLSDKPHAFRGMIYAAGHAGVHESFSVTSFSGGLVCSWQADVLEPFVSAAYERTRLTVRLASDAGLIGREATVYDPRVTVGLNIRPGQFVYMHAALSAVSSLMGFEYSLGVRF